MCSIMCTNCYTTFDLNFNFYMTGSDTCPQRSLDTVILRNDVTGFLKDDISQPPAEGVDVYDLYLQCTGWDRKNIRL